MSDNTERDPRTDPRPGDILEVGVHAYEILDVNDTHIKMNFTSTGQVTRDEWRKLMGPTRVIIRGAEGK